MAHPTTVVGYAFNADTYCPDCVPGDLDPSPDDPFCDDSEHYPQPLFGDTESLDSCAACHALLDTSWGPYEVDYAREMLTAYSHDGRGNLGFLLEIADNLSGCWLDFPAMLALARFNRTVERTEA